MDWPKPMSKSEAAEILGIFCANNLVLSGGFAVQSFLPEQFRKPREDDIDLTMFSKESEKEALKLLDKIARECGLSNFRVVREHSAKQPRREIFESKTGKGGHAVYLHVEKTDLNVPVKTETVKGSKGEKVKLLVPDVNFLFAKLVFGAGSPTRTWNRKLGDLAYICHLTHFQRKSISKKKVFFYLRKISGGKSAMEQGLANFSEVLRIANAKEIRDCVRKTRKGLKFDYGREIERLARAFKSSKEPDPKIRLSKKLHYLPEKEKKKIAEKYSVKVHDGRLLDVINDRLPKKSKRGKKLHGSTPRQLSRRLRRL